VDKFKPTDLDGFAALAAAHAAKPLRKQKGERDTEFVKRIVCAYLNADLALLTMRYEAIKAKQQPT
jgi:hypothetical protein